MRQIQSFGHCCTGQGLVEYALILLLIAVACFATVGLFGAALNALYAKINGYF